MEPDSCMAKTRDVTKFAILLFISGVVEMSRDRAMRAVEADGSLESADVKVCTLNLSLACTDTSRLLLSYALWPALLS